MGNGLSLGPRKLKETSEHDEITDGLVENSNNILGSGYMYQ